MAWGGVSLALVAALSLSSVLPVRATVDTAVDSNTIYGADTPTTGGSPTSSTVTETEGGIESDDHDNLIDGSASIDAYLNYPTTYTITVPKYIIFKPTTNTKANEKHKFKWKMTYNIPYTQTLTVTAQPITLKNAHGTGSAERTINTEMSVGDNSEQPEEKAPKNASVKSDEINVIQVKSPTTNPAAAANDSVQEADAIFYCELTNAQDINAGNWKGTLQFRAEIKGDEKKQN